jgi:elongation factor Ts
MMDCKAALVETGGDVDAAVTLLRKKGQAGAAKRAGRSANQGLIDSYIHPGGRVGVLLEVNCETDFVARTDRFSEFVHEVALHVAALKPLYVSADEVPEELIAAEREVAEAQSQNVPERARDKAVEGRVAKKLKEICLLDQAWVRDESKTIDELRIEVSADVGENVVIRRFSLYELGQ